MFPILVVLFIVLPIIEIYVLVQVADGLGWFNSLALIVFLSVLGAWLVKRQGFEILRRMGAQIADQKMPSNELVDGGLVLFAGALMLTPGFVTDAVGFFCLLPPTRALIRPPLVKRLQVRMEASPAGQSPVGRWYFGRGAGGSGGAGPFGAGRRGPVYDVPSEPGQPHASDHPKPGEPEPGDGGQDRAIDESSESDGNPWDRDSTWRDRPDDTPPTT